ncbi:hypothetical protein K0M31_019889, partial [Melipona bicolor]
MSIEIVRFFSVSRLSSTNRAVTNFFNNSSVFGEEGGGEASEWELVVRESSSAVRWDIFAM